MFYIKTDDNVKIAVQDINPKCKKTILFIHGWPLSRKIFEYQLNVLSKFELRCISIDIRGFGDSDCPAHNYNYDRLAKDIYTVIINTKPKNLTLAGFSMGGAIAIRYMSLFKGYGVSKLALFAAAAPLFTRRPNYPYGMTIDSLNLLIEQTYKDRPQMVSDFSKKLFAQQHSENFKKWMKNIGFSASGTGTIETAVSLRDEDLRDEICNINVPTGIFHGKMDQICPYEFALIMHESIKNSTLYTFENSGHGVFYDELEKFNSNLIDFLKL